MGFRLSGDLAYPAGFTHFNYANPDRKAARSHRLGVTTFNSLNNYILKGDATQLELLLNSLMIPATDEPDAVYSLVAESAAVADDKMSVTFYLRRGEIRRRHTGHRGTWSSPWRRCGGEGSPIFHQMLQDVVKAEAINPKTVRYEFKGELVHDVR